MVKTNLHPTTLNGIKTLAHDLKVHAGLTHTQGLNLASGLAGYPNFEAARKRLDGSPGMVPAQRFTLHLSAYWRDVKARASGRETLTITMAKPVEAMVSHDLMQETRYLGGFKRPGPDHLVIGRPMDSLERARDQLAGAARSFAFMEATGLVPTKAWKKQYPHEDPDNALPRHDHYGVWYDRVADQYVMTDEPYLGAIESGDFAAEREAWAREYNIDLRRVGWKGMYNPDGGARLFLFTDASTGYDLGRLVRNLDALPEPVGIGPWPGVSAPFFEDFVTPGTMAERALKAAAKPPRPPVKRGPLGPRNSVAMGGGRSRPAKKLDLAIHSRLGELLKAALRNTDPRYKAHQRIDKIRSRLEDWMSAEIGRTQPEGLDFFQVYYKELKDRSLIGARGREDDAAVARLDEVRAILVANYPESAPLRAMVAEVDKVRGYLDA